MTELATQFRDIVELEADGIGTAYEGMRANLRVLVRVFPAERAERLAEEAVARAAQFYHPVALELESGRADEGVWLSAPVVGISIAALSHAPGTPPLPPNQCIEIALSLLDLVLAARNAGTTVGPLLPGNVYLDPARPGWVRVLPLNRVTWRTADWLLQPASWLLCVDRGTLRQRPDERGAIFSIAALVHLLAKGPSRFDTAESAAAVIRRTIEQGHPLASGIERTDPFEALLSEVLSGTIANAAGFRDRLDGLRASYDTVARALAMHESGNALQAIAILHRAIKDGEISPRLYLLKARLEAEQGHASRSVQTLRDGRKRSPRSRAILELLAELTSDPHEAVDALRDAVRLYPTDPGLRMRLVEAVHACGDTGAALDLLDVVQTLVISDPGARAIWPRIAQFLLTCGMPEHAMRMAEPYAGSMLDADIRAAALAVIGRAQYAMQNFEQAVVALRQSLAAAAEHAAEPSIAVLNELAFALTALGRQTEAIEIAMRSLAIAPAQPQIIAFLRAVAP